MRLLSGIPDDQVEILYVPNELADKNYAEGFERVKDWEICYKGQMFDFFKEVRLSDSTVFYGITDHKENKLLADLKEALKQSDKLPLTNSPVPDFYRFLIGMHALLPEERFVVEQISKEIERQIAENHIVFRVIDPETPPPRASV